MWQTRLRNAMQSTPGIKWASHGVHRRNSRVYEGPYYPDRHLLSRRASTHEEQETASEVSKGSIRSRKQQQAFNYLPTRYSVVTRGQSAKGQFCARYYCV